MLLAANSKISHLHAFFPSPSFPSIVSPIKPNFLAGKKMSIVSCTFPAQYLILDKKSFILTTISFPSRHDRHFRPRHNEPRSLPSSFSSTYRAMSSSSSWSRRRLLSYCYLDSLESRVAWYCTYAKLTYMLTCNAMARLDFERKVQSVTYLSMTIKQLAEFVLAHLGFGLIAQTVTAREFCRDL
jgi:hypothetical protein